MEAMSVERTFVMLKPDAVKRGLVGEIIRRIEARGLKIVAMKMVWLDKEILKEHYAHHASKPFFPSLLEFMSSGPVICMVVEGPEAIDAVRKLMGKTNPLEAAPGTIRGDLALNIQNNLIHGSDSKEMAEEEIKRFFKPEEIFEYRRCDEDLVRGRS